MEIKRPHRRGGSWRVRQGDAELTLSPIGQVEIQLRQTDYDGAEVEIRLRLETRRFIDFAGVELGPLTLSEQDKFLGKTPGFHEKSGVVSALTAQAEGRQAALFALVVRPGRAACLAGIAATHDDASAFALVNDRLRAGFRPERELEAGEYVFKLFLGFGADPLELARRYGRYLAPMGRNAATEPPTGWNSWDFYGGAVTMKDIEAEMAALDRLKRRAQLRYLTIDMGWEEAWGDWRPNRKFPATLKAIAGKIRAAGWKPGLWFAPFQVCLFAPLARHRQDLFLRDNAGALIVVNQDTPAPCLLLDFSLPEVRELVGGRFAAARRAGFELFKVDYIYERFLEKATAPAIPTGKVAFARSIFQTVRDAIGPDACLVNCGGREEAVLGLADCSRVSMDIHNFWGHIKNNACQIARAFWANRQLWHNDPDFAIVRHRNNCRAHYLNMPYAERPLTDEGDFWMKGPEASPDELRLWLSVVRLNGGPIFLSDSIRRLSPKGRETLDRLFPPLRDGFDPLDLFERRYPGVWLSRDAARPTLGLFNWEDEPQTLELPPPLDGALSGKDFWSGEKIKLSGAARLAPRSGLLLEL